MAQFLALVEIDSIFDSGIASFTEGIPKTRHFSYLFLSTDETIFPTLFNHLID